MQVCLHYLGGGPLDGRTQRVRDDSLKPSRYVARRRFLGQHWHEYVSQRPWLPTQTVVHLQYLGATR